MADGGHETTRIRPLVDADLTAAAETFAAAFGIDDQDEGTREQRRERVAHSLRTDPDGGFLAERDGRIVGVAQAMQRERLWVLSLLVVEPGDQNAGIGRVLLERALRYGRPADGGLVVSSSDARAMRLYALSGFRVHPTLSAEGDVARSSLPRPDGRVREDAADTADLDALAAISREVRGSPHTDELQFALARPTARLLTIAARGFAVLDAEIGVWLLCARDDEAARALLWHSLEALPDTSARPPVRWITGAQDWAVDVVLRAGLRIAPYGALCVRGAPGTLRPYLPSGPFA